MSSPYKCKIAQVQGGQDHFFTKEMAIIPKSISTTDPTPI